MVSCIDALLFYYSGVVVVNIDLNTTDVNQCARDDGLFSNSDKCQPESTEVMYCYLLVV